jgi:hypothetical protein
MYRCIEVTTVGGEGGCKAVAEEGSFAVDDLDASVEFGVAVDYACQVSHFVEDGCEEVIFSCGFACGGSEC